MPLEKTDMGLTYFGQFIYDESRRCNRCSIGCEVMLMLKARIRLILSSNTNVL